MPCVNNVVLVQDLALFVKNLEVKESKCIAEKKVSKDFDSVADEAKLVSLFKEFDEQKDDGGDGVDREGQKFEDDLAMILCSFDQTVGSEKDSQ